MSPLSSMGGCGLRFKVVRRSGENPTLREAQVGTLNAFLPLMNI